MRVLFSSAVHWSLTHGMPDGPKQLETAIAGLWVDQRNPCGFNSFWRGSRFYKIF
jgi:hypothetical protein